MHSRLDLPCYVCQGYKHLSEFVLRTRSRSLGCLCHQQSLRFVCARHVSLQQLLLQAQLLDAYPARCCLCLCL